VLDDAKRNQMLDIAFLVLIFVVSIIVVNTLGNFPLNDDWSFARAVQNLVEKGDWRPTGFTAMPLITQSLWGAVFCLPAGFSFNALRISTLTLAIVGILGVYVLFVANNRGRLLAIIAALTFGFNPIYYELSTTFMTDVPFATFAILSSIFFVRCIRRFGYCDLSVASALAVAATLCRQLGLFLPLAFAVAMLMQRGFTTRRIPRALLPYVVSAILPSVVCAVALILFQQWMSITGRMPALYGTTGAAQDLSIRAIGSRTSTALLYLGLFCLPILVLGSSNRRLNTNSAILRVLPALSGGLFALLSIYFTFGMLERRMPIGGNILILQGLGPLSLHGAYEKLPTSFWAIVTALSIVGGMLLVRGITAFSMTVIEKWSLSNLRDEDIVQIFFLASAGTYAAPILIGGFYDRYLVPLVPFLLYLNTGRLSREDVGATMRKSVSAVLIVFAALFAVLGTRDYLTWNRVRWEALTELLKTVSVSARDIDGGYEYNGWSSYCLTYQEALKKLGGFDTAKYRVTYSEMPGFKTVKKYEYLIWMPPKVHTIYVLERNSVS
jgi:hypothetical protein